MQGDKYQRLIGYNIWNVIAIGGGKKGGIKILGLREKRRRKYNGKTEL